MSHYFIDKHDPRVADLFRRLEKAGKALDKLESSGGRTLKGERFVTDEELSRLLKISRRTLQEYRTARIIPYYLIQGKVLYMESEIQKFLEDSRKKCIGGQEWYKKEERPKRFGRSSFSVQYRVHAGGLPDDSGRRGPSDKPPSEGFGIPGF